MSINLAATSIRKTSLAQKVYAKAAEREALEKVKREQLTAAFEQELKRLAEAKEQLDYQRTQKHLAKVRERLREGRVSNLERKEGQAQKVFIVACEFFGISEADMLCPRALGRVARAMQIAWYVGYREFNTPYAAMGRAFRRHHTTVMSGVEKVGCALEDGDMETARAAEGFRQHYLGIDHDEPFFWGS
jgi:chromosomal replication initiation ATPase DnaA